MDDYNQMVKKRENINLIIKTPYMALCEKEKALEQIKEYKKEVSMITDKSIPYWEKEKLRIDHQIYEEKLRLSEISKKIEEFELYVKELEKKI